MQFTADVFDGLTRLMLFVDPPMESQLVDLFWETMNIIVPPFLFGYFLALAVRDLKKVLQVALAITVILLFVLLRLGLIEAHIDSGSMAHLLNQMKILFRGLKLLPTLAIAVGIWVALGRREPPDDP